MNDRLMRQAYERHAHQEKLEAKHGLTGHPKAAKLYALAWALGHSAGFGEVEICYDEMADLLKPAAPASAQKQGLAPQGETHE
jgi:hypothetical protein